MVYILVDSQYGVEHFHYGVEDFLSRVGGLRYDIQWFAVCVERLEDFRYVVEHLQYDVTWSMNFRGL